MVQVVKEWTPLELIEHYNRDKWFCRKCGTLCRSEVYKSGEYNVLTGVPTYYVVTKCPNKRWWNLHYSEVTYTGLPWDDIHIQAVLEKNRKG